MAYVRRALFLCILVLVGGGLGAAATTLRISLPPVFEALPIAFAEAWGMFDEAGLDVEVQGIVGDRDRTTALVTGNLDGMMSDVPCAAVAYANASGRSVVVVASAGSTPQPGEYGIVLASYLGWGPADIDGLLATDQPIGVTQRTNEEYVLDQFFAAHGQPRAWLTRYTVLETPAAVAALLNLRTTTVPVGALPEPYYTYVSTVVSATGVSSPLVVLTDFPGLVIPPRVLVFRKEVVGKRRDDVEAFLRVYDAAVDRMNATPREEIINVGLPAVLGLFFPGTDPATIQPQTLEAMPIPVFDSPAPLAQDIFDSLMEWMTGKAYLDQPISLAEFASSDLLP